MIRIARFLLLLGLIAVPWAVLAEERFPPPDFTSHKLPSTEVPPADSPAWAYVHLAVLTMGLGAASYLALLRRSRRGLFVVSLVMLAWLGFVKEGCICPIGAIQNVALALFDRTYTIPLTAIGLFVLPIVFTLFFGRTFCAAVCPLGAVQELAAVRPQRVPQWLDHALGLVRYVYLGAAVIFAATGTAFLICRYDPFVAIFRRSGSINMLVFGGAILVIGVFVGRPYCRYLCPMGAILGLCSRVAKWHLAIPPGECIRCRLCSDVCPYGAIVEPTVPQGPAERNRARRRLAWMIVLLPVWLLLGAGLGRAIAVPLAKLDPIVRLAERVRLEELGRVDGTTDASDAFRNTGRSREDLYQDAQMIVQRFNRLGVALGVWVGLVIGAKLISLSLRRRRAEYEPDRAGCVSCGRCFWYCPSEQMRLGLIENLSVDLHPGPALAEEPVSAKGSPAAFKDLAR